MQLIAMEDRMQQRTVNQATLRTQAAQQQHTATTAASQSNQSISQQQQNKGSIASTLPAKYHSFQQLTRLTIVLNSMADLQPLTRNSSSLASVLSSYDLIAVQPTTEALFHACAQSDCIDIVTLDCSNRLPFHLKRPSIELLRQKGIYIELSYGPALRHATCKRNLWATAAALFRVLGRSAASAHVAQQLKKTTGLILSSDAANAMELRAPADVINLALMLGCTPQVARAAIETHPQTVILHAKTKRTTKGVIVENTQHSATALAEAAKLKTSAALASAHSATSAAASASARTNSAVKHQLTESTTGAATSQSEQQAKKQRTQ